MFEAKDLHLGANLTVLSHSNEDLLRTVSLRHKGDVKVRLKYIIYPKRRAKKEFFQLQNRLPNMLNPCVKQLTSYNKKNACKIKLKYFTVSFINFSGCFFWCA